MDVSGTRSASSAGTAPATRGSQELGKDQFMRLMLTQMQNQDPTAPMDNQQMIAQMAQFSTLELMQRSEQTMSALLVAQAASNQQQAINLIDKSVVTQSDRLELTATGGPVPISMQLPQQTSALDIVILDENGNEVRNMKAGVQQAGEFTVPWDGRDNNGNRLPEGKYTVRITAIDQQGKDMGVKPQQVFHVDAVTFEDGIARLRCGDRTLAMNEIVEVR
jgi:flagellar basal-body rod modification protein FlgD